jgi:hypothetical protein
MCLAICELSTILGNQFYSKQLPRVFIIRLDIEQRQIFEVVWRAGLLGAGEGFGAFGFDCFAVFGGEGHFEESEGSIVGVCGVFFEAGNDSG